MNTTETAWDPRSSLAALSLLALLAGGGGMAASFLFLASPKALDVIAGASGFIAGAILAAAGLLSLSAQAGPSRASELAARGVRCFLGLLPAPISLLAWPVLYCVLFIYVIALMPWVLLGCAVAAWGGSRSVAENLCALLGWTRVRAVHAIVFVAQLATIAASWPLFRLLLHELESMGFKVGWS
jgi:hypothetical protein